MGLAMVLSLLGFVTPLVAGAIIGEFGKTCDCTTHAWKTVTLRRSYRSPIVVAADPENDGMDCSSTLVRNVNSNSFEVRISEPVPGHDDQHTTNRVYYMVIEQGDWILSDGSRISANKFATSSIYNNIRGPFSYQTVSMVPWSSAPLIFSQLQTNNHGRYQVTRTWDITSTNFKAAFQLSEYWHSQGASSSEMFGWIAWSRDTTINDGLSKYAVKTTSARTVDCSSYIDESFPSSFADYVLITKFYTKDDDDPAAVRWTDGSSSGFSFCAQEEQSYDSDLSHSPEIVSYVIRQYPGDVQGAAYSKSPTKYPTPSPTKFPTPQPSKFPTPIPTKFPTSYPTKYPTHYPSKYPTPQPSKAPSCAPSKSPTRLPSEVPTRLPSSFPTPLPTKIPTPSPTKQPTRQPSRYPTPIPTRSPKTKRMKLPRSYWQDIRLKFKADSDTALVKLEVIEEEVLHLKPATHATTATCYKKGVVQQGIFSLTTNTAECEEMQWNSNPGESSFSLPRL